jgi:hypothetical protein
MNVGVVPQYLDALGENRLFEFDGYDPFQRYGTDRIGFHELRRRFERAGDRIATVDRIDLSTLDRVVFVDMNFDYLDRLLSMDDPPGLVYVMREPPSVRFYNAAANLPRYAAPFDAVLTWNGSLASVDDRYTEYNIPQYLEPDRDGMAPFDERDLLVNVTSRKYSDHPDELYSAREDVIRYYDENHPEAFSLYGRYWNSRPRPEDVYHHRKLRARTYRTYEGLVDEKPSAYHRHRFALCFENMTGIDGYVTEKLFDCLRSGTVPVYWGAEDVDEYVPPEAFVDYREFGSPAALHEYLASVGAAEHGAYLDSAASFLAERPDAVSPETYAETVYRTTVEAEPSGRGEAVTQGLGEEIVTRGFLERLEDRPASVPLSRALAGVGRTAVSDPGLVLGSPSAVLGPIVHRLPV